MYGAHLIPLVAAAVLAVAPSHGATPDRRQHDDLKGRIETLRRQMAAAEESRTQVADQLRETESAISLANRRLHELAGQRATTTAQLEALETQRQSLDRAAGTQRTQLARLLHRQFVGGDADAMRLLLAGRDANQAARDRQFLTQIARAKADLARRLRAVAEEKRRLADEARERQAELGAIEGRERESRAQLIERRKQRATTLAAIGDRLAAQRREISTLRRDEQRMTRLIAGLARIAAARKVRPEVGAGATPNRPRAGVKSHDPGAVGGAFAALRGKLRLPVAGSVTGRFGAPRSEGGSSWKGIFIRAAEGAAVKSVAPGTVVFSDWMRGFGNLLVIDHGDDFLSVYGNNEALFPTVGARVTGGESVATVGNSGGNPDSGLYFELRHKGQPFDPMKWAGSR